MRTAPHTDAEDRGLSSPLLDLIGQAGRPAVPAWRRLTEGAASDATFDPAMVADLPEPARRWLTHAIAPGTPLWQRVELEMQGHIRIGRWLPFRAVQLHAPPLGYVWGARAAFGPVSIIGHDRFVDGHGEMHWALFGRVPVVNATGANLDRAAAGRAAIDALFVPTACFGSAVTWTDGSTRDSAIAEWRIGGHVLRPELTVAADGSLTFVLMPRWTQPKGEEWGESPFGGYLEQEADFGGIRIPTRAKVGYFPGTERWAKGEFFRATITSAAYS
jgi:hypothetical protein